MSVYDLVLKYSSIERGICGSFTSNGTNNYLDTGIVPTQDTVMKVWGSFNTTGDLRVLGVAGSPNEYLFGALDDDFWHVWAGIVNTTTTVNADTNLHLFEWNDAELYIDGVKAGGTKGTSVGTPTNPLWLFGAFNSLYANITIYKSEITHNSQVHVWDFNADGDETVKYTIDGVLQPSPTIQGTVTSGQWGTDCIDI